MGFDWGAIQRGFFDRAAVEKAAGRAKRKALSKQGAFIRTRAKTSIRKKKGTAPAGQPPHSHAGQLRLIFFAWDQQTGSVVVGPVPFQARGVGSGVVPKLLEYGGRAKGKHYGGNPFMRPAEQAERAKFTDQFKRSV